MQAAIPPTCDFTIATPPLCSLCPQFGGCVRRDAHLNAVDLQRASGEDAGSTLDSPPAAGLTRIKATRRVLCEIDGMELPLISLDREKIVSLVNETQYAANGIVSRTLLRAPNGRVVLFGFAEGQELTEHTSTQQALIEILSGECEFSLGGKPHPVKAGDLIYMPPGLPHAVKATKQFSMLLTLIKPA